MVNFARVKSNIISNTASIINSDQSESTTRYYNIMSHQQSLKKVKDHARKMIKIISNYYACCVNCPVNQPLGVFWRNCLWKAGKETV